MPIQTLVLEIIAPVFLLILLGFILFQARFPEPHFWDQVERLTYFLLFPALLLHRTATASLPGVEGLNLVLVLVAGLVAQMLLIGLLRLLPAFRGAVFGALVQGSIRFNTYIGIAILLGLNDPRLQGLMAIALAVLIPSVNVLSVSALSPRGQGLKRFARGLLLNPLILACLLGIGINLLALELPALLLELLDLLGRAALPLGLLAVGARLQPRILSQSGLLTLVISLIKLGVYPALVWGLAQAFQLGAPATLVAVTFAALPTAPSAFILSRLMGGDSRLMAALLTLQTALAMLTLPLWLELLLG